MSKIRKLLNLLMGHVRNRLANFRRWFLKACTLTPGHWKWAAWGLLILMSLFMLGMAIDFIGELHIGIFLGALIFFLGLALLSGLGVRFGLKLLNLLPVKQSWIYFAAVFFVMFMFGFPTMAMIVIAVFLIFSGVFLGGGIYNLTGGRWAGLLKSQRILTLVFLVCGSGLFLMGFFYLLYPGKKAKEVKVWSMETPRLPDHLVAGDPSRPGLFEIDSLNYGWGRDRHRKEFGEDADLLTGTVDGSAFLDGWEKFSGNMRTRYWNMGPDSLALNGRVWYPEGEGPFPLVLMVHGNHLDRDFSDGGYGYLGRHFASHGIIAVSVDENFLNGSWSDMFSNLKTENDCRGWLLLKHLEQWRAWNRCDSSMFYGRVDMDRVVLIGHSRGGEAVSIASCFNQLPFYPDNAEEKFDFNFNIKGIAAIAPVDGQYRPAGVYTPLENVNYFTIQGSMDADLRTYDGVRQMRRVCFNDSTYHFASGLYLHGANHGQFNRSWGLFDSGYPTKLFLNRKAIIPVEEQEKVALVYLTAFIQESIQPCGGYLPLFKDYRYGRDWLPGLVHLNQFHESSALILCGYEEDLDLSTGTIGIDSISADSLALWKEGRIPKKWGNQQNNGVFLGWNNHKDSIPGHYTLVLDPSFADSLEGTVALTFLAADAQIDPGDRRDEPGSESVDDVAADNEDVDDEKDSEDDTDTVDDEDPVPVDFTLELTDTLGIKYELRLGEFQILQPAIKPEVYKSRLFLDEPESEVVFQYVSLPLNEFKDKQDKCISAGAIRSITFIFSAEKKGTVLLDQIGFAW